MECDRRLSGLMGGDGAHILLPPMATPSVVLDSHTVDHFAAQRGNLVQFTQSLVHGQHMASSQSQSQSNRERASGGGAHCSSSEQVEGAQQRQRMLSQASSNSLAHCIPAVGSNLGSSSVMANGLSGVYHAGLSSVQTGATAHQTLGIHNFPAQQLALGLQQHKGTLLQVPHAQLQAMSNVGATVQGVASVLPFFQTSHAATAPGVQSGTYKTAGESQGLQASALGGLVSGLPSVGNGSTSMGHTQTQANLTSSLHMMASSILGSDQNSSNGNSSNGGSSTTTNQNSNSGSASDDDTREQDGGTSRRIARREYHKKIERKRRDRMRSLYDELRSLTDAAELADKNGVLESAITLIQQLRQENHRLKIQKTCATAIPQHLASLGHVSPSNLPGASSDERHAAALGDEKCRLEGGEECGSSEKSSSFSGACPSESSARGMLEGEGEDNSCASSSSAN